jgi:hypothetical protein
VPKAFVDTARLLFKEKQPSSVTAGLWPTNWLDARWRELQANLSLLRTHD